VLSPLSIAGLICCGTLLCAVVFVAAALWSGTWTVSRTPLEQSVDSDNAIETSVEPPTEALRPPPTILSSEPGNVELPAWVPVYPHPKIMVGSRRDIGGVIESTVTYECSDSVELVTQFYESRFKADGFEAMVDKRATRSLEQTEISVDDNELKRKVRVTVRKATGPTVITVTCSDATSTNALP